MEALRALLDSLDAVNGIAGINRVRSSLRTMEDESARAHQLAMAGRTALADSIIDRAITPTLDDVERIVALSEQTLQDRTRERVNDIAEASVRSRTMSLRLLGAAAVLAVLIGLWLTQSVSRPIDELDAGMRAVAEGDFGHPLQLAPQRRDEFGRLAKSYNSMATQLRELDRLKAEFISVASHELKTPINVVMGYLQLLQDHVYGELNDRQREIVGTLTAQSKSLSRLVRQLLDVSRFEAGGGKVEPRTIPFPAFLGDLERNVPRPGDPARRGVLGHAYRRPPRRGALGSGAHQRGAGQPPVQRLQVHPQRRACLAGSLARRGRRPHARA